MVHCNDAIFRMQNRIDRAKNPDEPYQFSCVWFFPLPPVIKFILEPFEIIDNESPSIEQSNNICDIDAREIIKKKSSPES